MLETGCKARYKSCMEKLEMFLCYSFYASLNENCLSRLTNALYINAIFRDYDRTGPSAIKKSLHRMPKKY